MCTPYKIEAFADDSRSGEEACKYERVKQKMNKIQEEGSFLHMGNIPFFFMFTFWRYME